MPVTLRIKNITRFYDKNEPNSNVKLLLYVFNYICEHEHRKMCILLFAITYGEREGESEREEEREGESNTQ